MAEVDESVKVNDFLSLLDNWKCDKQQKQFVHKLQQIHEKEMKKRAVRLTKEQVALEKRQRQEEKMRAQLEKRQRQETERKERQEEKMRAQLEKRQRQETERKARQEEKLRAQLEKCQREKRKDNLSKQRGLVTDTISMMNGNFGGRLPALMTRDLSLVNNYSWLPSSLHSKLGSCKFSIPSVLDDTTSIFYFLKERDLNRTNMFVTVKGSLDRSHFRCSVIVHGLVLMFAIASQRERIIFVVDHALDKVLFENDLLLAKYIQSRSMIKLSD